MPRPRKVKEAGIADITVWWAAVQALDTPKQMAAKHGISVQHLLRLAKRSYVHKRTKYELSQLLRLVSRETFIGEQNKERL